jgi:GDP-L-fucose synthase
MNIIVTGSNGLVGKSLQYMVYMRKIDDLAFSNNYNWIFTTRKELDLSDIDAVQSYLEKYDADKVIVVNLAANVGGLFKNINANLEMFESNLKINYNLLSVCSSLKIKKVINILSTCIFPDKIENYPITEEMINRGEPHNSNKGYSYGKRFGQIYSSLINNSSTHFNYVNIIPTNLYGKYDNFKIENAHVIPAIIHKCYKATKGGNQDDSLTLPGDGTAERMFLHVDDLSNVIIDIVYKIKCRGDYIVSGNELHSVKISELANMISEAIAKLTSCRAEIEFKQSNEGNGQNKKPCSNAKLQNLYEKSNLNMPIKDNLENNLNDIINWFFKNYKYIERK